MGKKVFIITHGTDVWFIMSRLREAILREANGILSVSRFIKQKFIDVHYEKPTFNSFYNTLDPYFGTSFSSWSIAHLSFVTLI